MDFSDRITGKRKSYKASSRRQRKGGEEFGDFSDEEDGESLERKMARLRREIEEVKEEAGRRRAEKARELGEGEQEDEEGKELEDAAALSRMLDGIAINHDTKGSTAGSRLVKALETSLQIPGSPSQSASAQKDGKAATYTVTYAPTYQQSHALAKTAAVDARLTLLEKALGISSTDLPALDSKGTPLAILPTLSTLQRQITVLTESTPSSLDSISRRVRTLTQESERLAEARRSAKLAKKELVATGKGDSQTNGENNVVGDDEQVAKINALYGTLGTIENLSPLLPSLLDRLRSLRAIHAEAATASENLERAMRRQEEMGKDLARWREGLERVENAVKSSEGVVGGNMKVMEGWVKDLEERMGKLGV